MGVSHRRAQRSLIILKILIRSLWLCENELNRGFNKAFLVQYFVPPYLEFAHVQT